MKQDKPITQQIFIEDDELEVVVPEPLKKGAVKTKSDKKEESKLHSSRHNIIDLPSNGRFGYPSQVEYRDIMVEDEEILSTATETTFARTFNSVIRGVINNCEFYEDLTLQDRDYIVLWVWANNYGLEKKIEYTCHKCKTENLHTVDLTKIEDIPINPKTPVPYILSTKIGGDVEIKFLTVADELFIESFESANSGKYTHDLLRLARQIKLPVEPISFEQKVEWVKNNITSRERKVISAFFEKFAYGYKTVVDYTCVNKECGEVTRGELPFQVQDILFPTVHTDFEEYL